MARRASRRLLITGVAAATVAAGAAARAQPVPTLRKIDFVRDVQPVLQTSCTKCHGAQKKSGQLRLDAKPLALKGGVSGAVILPGRGLESPLIKALLLTDPEERMPRKADPLPTATIDLLRAWIDQGAEWPDGASAPDVRADGHWAYRKPVRSEAPKVKLGTWVKNPIDAFILARLEKEGLAPAPEASRETLIRRVTLDLTGLPPTVKEVDAFLADRSAHAYDDLVTRLLASPHYGERWARVWLDFARYADTNGYEKDNARTMWKYRDWVIGAFNRDTPFDEFTIDQIAGDMLPGAGPDLQIASGFNANTMLNEEGGVDGEEARYEVLVDRVNTTGAVWLGTTIACSQCHNHKYDPFSQKDYYGLLAFFDNGVTHKGRVDGNAISLEDPKIKLATPAQEATLRSLEAEIAERQRRLDAHTPELDAEQAKWVAETKERLEGWTVVPPAAATATGDASLIVQGDGSVRAEGKNPTTSDYTLVIPTKMRGVTGFRLEVLPDKSLPRGGPGRAPNAGFVLTEFKVRAAPTNAPSDSQAVPLGKARSDSSNRRADVAGAVDGNPETGWALGNETGESYTAVFETKAPFGGPGGTTFTVTLEQRSLNPQHTLGRLRVSLTTVADAAGAVTLPQRIRRLLANRAPGSLTGDEANELGAYYRTISPSLKAARDEIDALRTKIDGLAIPTALVLQERPSFERPSTRLRIRGGFTNPGERVFANVPAALPPLADDQPPNRLGFARWLVHKDNPLTARVTVNRFWEQYFGKGIVETSEDFGAQGSPPSHPELLDWLATEFMARGWSMKALHRLIVTSAAYRQSSHVDPALLEKDPYNRLLARGPRFRLEAEMLRDFSLAASGLLSRKVGGPSVFPVQPPGIWNVPYSGMQWKMSVGEDRYRRGLYTFWRRSTPYPMMTTFDAPSREVCAIRRVRTNTPLQALTLLNDTAFVEAARSLARRIAREGGTGSRARAAYGFRLCAARRPEAREIDRLVALYKKERGRFATPGGGAAELLAGMEPPVPSAQRDDLAAWTLVANVLLNLDETQTKE